jgi:hypothetical protein
LKGGVPKKKKTVQNPTYPCSTEAIQAGNITAGHLWCSFRAEEYKTISDSQEKATCILSHQADSRPHVEQLKLTAAWPPYSKQAKESVKVRSHSLGQKGEPRVPRRPAKRINQAEGRPYLERLEQLRRPCTAIVLQLRKESKRTPNSFQRGDLKPV